VKKRGVKNMREKKLKWCQPKTEGAPFALIQKAGLLVGKKGGGKIGQKKEG